MYHADWINMEDELAGYEEMVTSFYDPNKRHAEPNRNRDSVNKYLGTHQRSVEAFSAEPYYGELLAWSVQSVTSLPGWKTTLVRGHTYDEPIFRDIKTDYANKESCLVNGQMLMRKDDIRLVVNVTVGREIASVQMEAAREHQEIVKQLIKDIEDYLKGHNFYQGKKLCFDGQISFLTTREKSWDSVILDPAMKQLIRLNTIGFLKHCKVTANYGIPSRRGIILNGEPGVGKTAVCKALISEASDITCIITNAYGMLRSGYISDLFDIARDLAPSMVFLEDLDLIGQERQGFYRGTPPLIELLAEMDGIQEKTAIVTIATTNCIETLDEALSQRPSRFDWVCKIPRPDYQRRIEMLNFLATKIPLSEDNIEYIAKKTEGFTPAQLQEVPHFMVIAQIDKANIVTEFSQEDINTAISQVNFKKSGAMGFSALPIIYSGVNQNRQQQ